MDKSQFFVWRRVTGADEYLFKSGGGIRVGFVRHATNARGYHEWRVQMRAGDKVLNVRGNAHSVNAGRQRIEDIINNKVKYPIRKVSERQQALKLPMFTMLEPGQTEIDRSTWNSGKDEKIVYVQGPSGKMKPVYKLDRTKSYRGFVKNTRDAMELVMEIIPGAPISGVKTQGNKFIVQLSRQKRLDKRYRRPAGVEYRMRLPSGGGGDFNIRLAKAIAKDAGENIEFLDDKIEADKETYKEQVAYWEKHAVDDGDEYLRDRQLQEIEDDMDIDRAEMAIWIKLRDAAVRFVKDPSESNMRILTSMQRRMMKFKNDGGGLAKYDFKPFERRSDDDDNDRVRNMLRAAALAEYAHEKKKFERQKEEIDRLDAFIRASRIALRHRPDKDLEDHLEMIVEERKKIQKVVGMKIEAFARLTQEREKLHKMVGFATVEELEDQFAKAEQVEKLYRQIPWARIQFDFKNR